MGGGSWSNEAYVNSTTERLSTRGSVFAHDADVRSGRAARGVHESLSPHGVRARESRDSTEHPESNAVIVGLDVTGSMARVVGTIHEKLPSLMTLLSEKGYLRDPQVMFAAVGDHHGDAAPLQVGQFESDARVEEHLSNMFIERGGGSTAQAKPTRESYSFLALFAAIKTSIDCHEKRGKKGYLFIVGDEMNYDSIHRNTAKQLLDYDLETDLTTAQIYEMAKEKYNVFFILPRDASHGGSTTVINHWAGLIGRENVIELDRADMIAELIALKIGAMEGTVNVARARSDLANNPSAASVISTVYGRVLDL